MSKEHKVRKSCEGFVNAYFNFVSADTSIADIIIAKIYSVFKDIDVTGIKLYRNCYLIDSNSNSNKVKTKKVLSLFVIINEIELIEYYKIVNIIDDACLEILKDCSDELLFVDTNYTTSSTIELSDFNNDYINLKTRDFLINYITGYDLFIRTCIDVVILPKYSSFKLTVYAVDTDNLIDKPNKRANTLADNLSSVFKYYDYFDKNESNAFKSSIAKNVSLFPNVNGTPLSNVVEYQYEYNGCIEMYNACIDNLISLAKTSRREIIGIIVINENGECILKYKSHPGYRIYLSVPSDDKPEVFNQIVF